MRKKFLLRAVGVVVFLLVAAQFVQPERANPRSDPAASFRAVANPHPGVAAIVERSCRDCHSNQTVWPWYSRVSPVSWMVANDVKEGRTKLNFSQWNIYGTEMSQIRLREACEQVKAGKMPLPHYLPLHPEARLSAEDVRVFCAASEGATP
jgi:hypothetical protein